MEVNQSFAIQRENRTQVLRTLVVDYPTKLEIPRTIENTQNHPLYHSGSRYDSFDVLQQWRKSLHAVDSSGMYDSAGSRVIRDAREEGKTSVKRICIIV